MARLSTQQLILIVIAVITLALLILFLLKLNIPQQTNETINQTASAIEEIIW